MSARTDSVRKPQGASSVFQKLNLKTQREIVVFNVPESFEPELERLDGVKILRAPQNPLSLQCALAFATRQAEVDRLSKILAVGSPGDAMLWFAYPKGTSKRY